MLSTKPLVLSCVGSVVAFVSNVAMLLLFLMLLLLLLFLMFLFNVTPVMLQFQLSMLLSFHMLL